jgi:acyl dehydratase
VADDTTTSGPRILDGADEIRDAVGTHLGYSEWVLVTQERVNRFADATGDHQWIHVDVERAERESPYGGTIAHGYLTMSMSNELVPQGGRMTGFAMGINYGVDKVRFPSAVKVGSRIRAGVVIADVTDVAGGIQVKMAITIEVEGSDKPACVIESLARWVA